jgi:hypothetical protein
LDCDVEKVKKWIIKKKFEGQPVACICVQVGISRSLFFIGGIGISLVVGGFKRKT